MAMNINTQIALLDYVLQKVVCVNVGITTRKI